jgi:hypothetical protein
MHKDDLVQLEASFLLYDAFYRWSRDAVSESHNWPTPRLEVVRERDRQTSGDNREARAALAR